MYGGRHMIKDYKVYLIMICILVLTSCSGKISGTLDKEAAETNNYQVQSNGTQSEGKPSDVEDTEEINSQNDSTTKNVQVIVSDDQTNSNRGLFWIGMSKDELNKILKDKNKKILLDEDHGTAGSSIWCEDVQFFISPDGKVSEIYVHDNVEFETLKGLRIGDNIEKLIELYGENYTLHLEEDVTLYQFRYSTNYFNIGVDSDDKVIGWGISKGQ